MLGPLPDRYRHLLGAIVVAMALVVGLAAGAAASVPVLPMTALAVALPAGAALAYLLLHDFSHR